MSTESSKDVDAYVETALKAYTSGDPMTFERKFRQPIDAIPTAKVMIATNELPKFQDKSSGVWRRMLFVPFERTFQEEDQNKNLTQELAQELPGIFNWALEGMRQLWKQGGFIKAAKCEEALAQYRMEMNPARTFLEETYEEWDAGEVAVSELYQDYEKWCQDNGHKPLSQSNLGREVRRAFPNVQKVRPTKKGKRVHVYKGLSEVRDDPSIPF